MSASQHFSTLRPSGFAFSTLRPAASACQHFSLSWSEPYAEKGRVHLRHSLNRTSVSLYVAEKLISSPEGGVLKC